MTVAGERLAVLAALAWLVFMAGSGQVMQQGQFVAFEAAGLMVEPPAAVTRVGLSRQGEARVIARDADGRWTLADRRLPAEVAAQIDLAVKFLHTARPLRELGAPGEDPGYGLGDHALRVSVERVGAAPLVLVFGLPGTEPTTQYLASGVPPTVWLVSRFVGEAWEAAWNAVR